ncbi:unnamed protein product, partial [Iphiclides podalirius]
MRPYVISVRRSGKPQFGLNAIWPRPNGILGETCPVVRNSRRGLALRSDANATNALRLQAFIRIGVSGHGNSEIRRSADDLGSKWVAREMGYRVGDVTSQPTVRAANQVQEY